MDKQIIHGDILESSRSALFERLVGAPKGSLLQVSDSVVFGVNTPPLSSHVYWPLQNLHCINSWISSLSPEPLMQSAFYRALRSLIGLFITTTVSSAAAYTTSPLLQASDMEIATANILDMGFLVNIPGLSDRIAPVLHLAVIWNAVLRIRLAAPNASIPVLPDATFVAQLKRLLQAFVDISPSPTLDPLISSVTAVTAKLATLPVLDHYCVTCTVSPEQSTSVEVEITRCA